jgi:hypothetical protein
MGSIKKHLKNHWFSPIGWISHLGVP